MESFVLMVGSNLTQPAKSEARVSRTASGNRHAKPLSKPPKSSLSASSGQSYKVSRDAPKDAEFIQISHQMPISKERAASAGGARRVEPPTPPVESDTEAIELVHDRNVSDIMLKDDGDDDINEETASQPPAPPANTPPTSRMASPDIHYAFNIPTGRSTEMLSKPTDH
jgi:hypothetical protein